VSFSTTHRSLVCTSEPWVPKNPSKGLWLAVGAGVGVAVGVAINNVAMSLAVGVAIGAVIDWFTRNK
jgi:LPS O-antigen subunit length determinant protein (WzzB/FepE family)